MAVEGRTWKCGDRACLHPVSGAAALLALLSPGCCLAGAVGAFDPSAVFVQAGSADDTHELSAGLTWDSDRVWRFGSSRVGLYLETSMSRWSYPSVSGRSSAWLLQLGIKPVFRWRASEDSRWFAEGGIGASFTTNLYETSRKRFSTTFNFGDHLAIGFGFGAAMEHELSLRVEHFSNAGIKHPNPGENFVQLRYLRRF